MKDPNYIRLKDELTYFQKILLRSGPSTQSVIYFAGHGFQVDGRNFLVPANAALPVVLDKEQAGLADLLPSVAVPLDDFISLAPSEGSLVLVDACRNNPWDELVSKRGLQKDRGLAEFSKKTPNTTVVFSTSPGDFAQDGEGDNSRFAIGIASSLLNRFPSRKTLLGFLDDLRKYSPIDQVPYISGALSEDICMSGCARLSQVQYDRLVSTGGFVSQYEGYPSPPIFKSQIGPSLVLRGLVSDDQVLGLAPRPPWADGFAEEVKAPARNGSFARFYSGRVLGRTDVRKAEAASYPSDDSRDIGWMMDGAPEEVKRSSSGYQGRICSNSSCEEYSTKNLGHCRDGRVYWRPEGLADIEIVLFDGVDSHLYCAEVPNIYAKKSITSDYYSRAAAGLSIDEAPGLQAAKSLCQKETKRNCALYLYGDPSYVSVW